MRVSPLARGVLAFLLIAGSRSAEAAPPPEVAATAPIEGNPTPPIQPIEPVSPPSAEGEGDCAGTLGPEAEAPASTAEALGRQPARVKCLDESLIDEFGRARSRKGVQPRFFRKAHRIAVTLGGGGWGGDLVSTNWQLNGDLAFWISEDFGIDVSFGFVPMDFRLERSATGFTGADRFSDRPEDRWAYVGHGHLLWAPLHTKLRASEERIIHGDIVLFAGAGKTFHDSVRGASFDVGASLYLYPTRFLSVRFDVSDLILAQEVLGSQRIANNIVFTAGLGLWIPFRTRG